MSRDLPQQPYGLCECGCGSAAPIAKYTRASAGWVKGQPKRFISGHSRRATGVLWEEVGTGYETPCWLWLRNAWRHAVYDLAGASPDVR